MADTKTEPGSCRFVVEFVSGRTQIVLQTFHGSISLLRDAVIGFNMLGGISPEQAKKVADMLNEHILDLFVSVTK